MPENERQEFLSEPHVAALSVSAGDGRAPLTVPIWYQYRPGDDVWVLTGTHSRKAELLEAAGRFSLMVDRTEPTTRYVTVEGAISRIEPGTDEQMAELAHRYLPADAAERYLQFAHENLGDHIAVFMRPEHWLSADMGSF